MHEQGAWWLHRYYPPDPAPGTYAISVANLMGGIWNSQADYAYFRDREPDANIGHTIYVYDVSARGLPMDLSLAGLQLDQIDPKTYQQFGTNDVRPRWFDATSSIIATPGQTWIALADDQLLAPEFKSLFADAAPVIRATTTDDQRPYVLYHFDLGQRMLQAAQQSEQAAQDIGLPVNFGGTAELIGYRVVRNGQDLTLVTYWRAGDQVVTPLQMFVHIVGSVGSIMAQADRLDASPFGWRAGDLIAQVHHLALPPQSNASTIAIGLYNPDSGVRLPIVVDGHEVDQLVLKQVVDQ
jgi:hypothetical protein